MTMIAAATFTGRLGVLAWDSLHQIPQPDGSVSYEAGHAPGFRAVPDGFVACGGSFDLARLSLDLCAEGGTLEELAERIAPELTIASASAEGSEHSQTVMLTTRSGHLECGLFKPADGLQRFPDSARVYIPPSDDALWDAEALHGLYEEFAEATTRPGSTLDVLRAVGAFYSRAGALTPALSGSVCIGVLARWPDGSWASQRLDGGAADIAHASDAELTDWITEPLTGSRT